MLARTFGEICHKAAIFIDRIRFPQSDVHGHVNTIGGDNCAVILASAKCFDIISNSKRLSVIGKIYPTTVQRIAAGGCGGYNSQ